MLGKEVTSVFKGALLTVSMRWAERLIGFTSTLILARLLLPQDFGIIAMASIAVGLVDVLLDIGVNVALIQNKNPTPAHYNAAWTLRLAQSSLAAILIFIAAPFAAIYFGDTRITLVLQVMAFSMWLVGFENIGVITFQKEMRFGLDFRFVFLKRLSSFFVTIFLALIFRSYWALIAGTIASRLFGIFLSYYMHPMRPRLSTEKFSEIFSVSQWMLVNSIGGYLNRNLHKFLVGRRSTAEIMGGYTLSDEISAMPSTELLAPINRVLFPAFVKAKNDKTELRRIFLLAQGLQSLVGIAAGVGLALVAHEAVFILLGEKWLFIVPFVQILALSNIIDAITSSATYVLLTLGRLSSTAFFHWSQVTLFIVAALFIFPSAEVLQLAWLRLAAVFFGLAFSIFFLMSALDNIRLKDIIQVIIRPITATAVMALVITIIGNLEGIPAIAGLTLKIASGLLTYPTVILLMWRLAGEPDGAESYLINKIRKGFSYSRSSTNVN